jgi:hypothetical protein
MSAGDVVIWVAFAATIILFPPWVTAKWRRWRDR